jgi:hypothetical protein
MILPRTQNQEAIMIRAIGYFCLIMMVVGTVFYFVDSTATTCFDGSKITFPFNTGDISLQQVGVLDNGSVISCTGEIYPPETCSMLFYGICQLRSGTPP